MEFRVITKLEIMNEINLLFFNYSLFLYTELVPKVETRYAIGYYFIFLASACLIFNFSIISYSVFKEGLLDFKKKKAEKAWAKFNKLQDKMVSFLARRAQERIHKALGVSEFTNVEAQERAIKQKLKFSEMEDKIVKILNPQKKV